MADPPPSAKQTLTDGRLVHSIPIVDRLPPLKQIRARVLAVLFFVLLTWMHLSQLALWPLSLVPGGLRELYWDYVRHSKESFARLLVYISRDTTLVITADDSLNLDKVVQKNKKGETTGLTFSKRAVWMANHQQYADWIYIWALMYKAKLSGALVIILKASLRNIPVAGPAMRLFKFIFLAGSWEKDRTQAGKTMVDLGRRATRDERGLALLIFPEGTLVSKLTRPGSAKYGAKIGTPDMKNMLLPRSTGLLFSLRTILPYTPDLDFYDITIGYPGLPAAGFAQTYYTLASIFTANQAPPSVHLHIRSFDLATVPLGANVDKGTSESVTEEERKVFDEWVRKRWTEKDALLDVYYKNGEFPAKEGQRVEVPLSLEGIDDWLAVFSNLVPAYIAYRAALLAWRVYKARYA